MLGVRAMFAERQEGKLYLRRGFSLEPGERVLVVEDVVTTGLSTRETIEVARAAGAEVVGAAAIIDRSGGEQALDVPFYALATVSLPTYEPAECPQCLTGEPVIKPDREAEDTVPGPRFRVPCSGSGFGEPGTRNRELDLVWELGTRNLEPGTRSMNSRWLVPEDHPELRRNSAMWAGSGRRVGESVQGLLEEAVARFEGERGQCAGGRPDRRRSSRARSGRQRGGDLRPSGGDHGSRSQRGLPPDVRVIKVEDAAEDFHARFSARSKNLSLSAPECASRQSIRAGLRVAGAGDARRFRHADRCERACRNA